MPFITQGKTNWKFLLIVIILAITVGAIALWYEKGTEQSSNPVEIQKIEQESNQEQEKEQKSIQEQRCIDSGGTVSIASCCQTTSDFPNSCLVGACGCSLENSHQVKACDCGGGKCFDGENCVFILAEEISVLSKNFSYPYPLSWQENGIYYDLTGVSLGEISAPYHLKNSSGGYYKEGEKVYALSLILKIKSPITYTSCVPMNLRRELNELGDMASPNNEQFYFPDTGGCMPKKDVTYSDQNIIFVVPESEKLFTFTTGGQSKIFFTVRLLDNDELEVKKVYLIEKG